MSVDAWSPIADLPPEWRVLAVSELRSQGQIWREQRVRLERSAAVREFHQRLRRQWAIETGVIEHLYTIDRGTTQLLIERGIDASLIPHGATDRPAEQVVTLVRDQQEALEGVFDFVASRRPLSTSYIKELHQVLTRHQETVEAVNGMGRRAAVQLRRGDWKLRPNNPTRPDGTVHHYCPPEHVAVEMDRLVELHLRHQEEGVPPEVEAAWLHHRFTQIHPFQDGNGRVARALASLVFLRAGWFPLVVRREDRESYIGALEAADRGELEPLVRLCAGMQKRALVGALSTSEDVLHQLEPVQQVVTSAAERLRERKRTQQAELRRAFDLARALQAVAKVSLEATARSIQEEIGAIDTAYGARVEESAEGREHWFRWQIIQTAIKLDYYADTRTYRSWICLKIDEERQAELLISFHALGVEFLGLMAASASISFRDKGQEDESRLEGPHPACREVFQFAYNEAEAAVRQRFEEWLREALTLGLDIWRRQI